MKKQNTQFFTQSIFIYLIGILFSIIYFYKLYTIYNKQSTILLIILSFVIIILIANCYFSYKDSLKNFDQELNQYSYVEQNARVLLTASLAFVLFFNYMGLSKVQKDVKMAIEIPVVMSFIFSSLILILIWMPKDSGLYIRILRDIKTIFLTLAIASALISMTNVVSIKRFNIVD